MDEIRTNESLNYVSGFQIGLQEVIINIQLLKPRIVQFYNLLANLCRADLFNNRNARADITLIIPLEIIRDEFLGAPGGPNYVPLNGASIPLPRPLPNGDYRVSDNGITVQKPFLFSLADPLILNIFIAKAQFHHFVEAVKAIQDERLRNTLIGIMKYSLSNETTVLTSLREYVMSELMDPYPAPAPYVFVKLKTKPIYYIVDISLLTKFNAPR